MAEDSKDPTPPATEDGDPFLVRWSRRKQAARETPAQAVEATSASPADAEEAGDAGANAQGTEPDTLPDDSLPPPESLDSDSDFSAYLSRRVSSGLRRAAMRRLFSLPEFNVRDGLDDYDDDYTGFQSLGNTVTAHMKYHTERLQAREEAKQAAARSDDGDGAGQDEAPAPDGDAMTADADTPATEAESRIAADSSAPPEEAEPPGNDSDGKTGERG